MEYIVYDDCYFCYPLVEEWRNKKMFRAVVMRADVEKGGDPLMIDHIILVFADKAKEATKEDSERFLVKID